jgi:hypothetical protein
MACKMSGGSPLMYVFLFSDMLLCIQRRELSLLEA